MTLFVIFYSYQFVRTILSLPFCPLPFCPRTSRRRVNSWHRPHYSDEIKKSVEVACKVRNENSRRKKKRGSLNSIRGSQWRSPGAEFMGTEKIFADQDEVFSKKISIFTAKISDDPFFSRRPNFSDFPFLLPDFSYLCYIKCHIIITLS